MSDLGNRLMVADVEQISRVIREFDAQGWHRTGTEPDAVSARWLADLARERGLEPALEPFALDRVALVSCYLESGGRRIDGLPLFDGAFTDASGVRGRLGPLGSEAAIGVAGLSADSGVQPSLHEVRQAGSHRAIVAITHGRSPGLAPANAPAFLAPVGPPTLQVTSDLTAFIEDQVRRGAPATLVAHAERTSAEALNVLVTVRGRDPHPAPLVVSTPRSSWWQSTSERGGGIACWLESLSGLADRTPARDVAGVALSGHELGFLGLKDFLARRPGLERRAHVWIHFGANIGAATDPSTRFSAPDDALEALIAEQLRRAGVTDFSAAPRGTVAGGESREVAARGGRSVGVGGGNALFHLEADRWPHAVDVAAVARLADAFAGVVRTLANDPGD